VAFFRWQAAGEPFAVHFHLNTVELLEREAKRGGDKEVSGLLLGRREQGRQLSFVVEDFEAIPLASANNGSASPANGDVIELTTDVRYLFVHGQLTSASSERRVLEAMVNRWHTKPEKRMSILGFYRSCPKGAAVPDEDDFAALALNPAKSEQLLLMIEPRAGQTTNASLFMVHSGGVQWKWPSVQFNRLELAKIGSPLRPTTISRPQENAAEPRAKVEEKAGFKIAPVEEPMPREQARPENHDLAWRRKLMWILAPLAVAVVLGLSILQLRGRPLLGASSEQDDLTGTSDLGLTLNRTGSDWQVGWNRNAPVLLKSLGARLSISDGPIRKQIDLDASELRNGSIVYTPVTDDVVLKLETVDRDSGKLVSESTHIVAGLLPPAENLGAASRKAKH
jgi:hypothetical protein